VYVYAAFGFDRRDDFHDLFARVGRQKRGGCLDGSGLFLAVHTGS
jgi:hypothetical protein